MALRAYKKTYTNDYHYMLLQNNLEEFTKQLLTIPILNGHLLRDVTLTSGSVNLIPHKLDRLPNGWLLVKNNTDSRIWETTASTTVDLLALNTSSSNIVSIWVF